VELLVALAVTIVNQFRHEVLSGLLILVLDVTFRDELLACEMVLILSLARTFD
jgi:hypothetical protein